MQPSGGKQSGSGSSKQGKAGPGHGTQIGAASPDGERRRDLRWPGEGVTRTRSSIGAAVRVMRLSRAVVMGWREGAGKIEEERDKMVAVEGTGENGEKNLCFRD